MIKQLWCQCSDGFDWIDDGSQYGGAIVDAEILEVEFQLCTMFSDHCACYDFDKQVID